MEIEEEDTLNADLAAAWADAEGDTDGEDTNNSERSAEASAEALAPAEGTDDEGGVPAEPEAGAEPGGLQRGGEEGEVAARVEELTLDTAPKGLSPEAREAWKDTPKPIKEMMAKREADFEKGIVQYASNAKRAEAMDRTLKPYEQFFAMNGGAQKTLTPLLQTGAILQMGSPQQKAQTVANLVKQFGVDISALDNYLVGGDAPKGMQQQTELDRMFNERLAPLQQQLQTYQQRDQQQAQQSQQQIQAELANFATKNEFYADVRSEMADLLDMAANRGREMTPQEAYNIACSTHPSISKIMQNRSSQQSVSQKRNAASSIRGVQGSDGMGGGSDNRLTALSDAWDNAGRM